MRKNAKTRRKNAKTGEPSPGRNLDARRIDNPLGEEQFAIEASIAGEAGDTQDLSAVEDVNEESVEELAASGQAMEASVVDGVEDAADHPERPVHTHEDYGRPEDVPPRRKNDAA